MTETKIPTRQRLIDAAKARFYRDGFRNAGLDAILADVGIGKTAFYKHFDSKDGLIVAVLEDVDRVLQRDFRHLVKNRGGPTGLGQIRALMDVVHEEVMGEDFHGCIFVGAAMEFPLPHDPAHRVAARHKHAIEEFVFELAERAGVADPKALAQELCLIMEGAYVTRSVTGDPSTIAIARRVAERVLERHLPSSAAAVQPLAIAIDVPRPRAD